MRKVRPFLLLTQKRNKGRKIRQIYRKSQLQRINHLRELKLNLKDIASFACFNSTTQQA